MLYEKGGCHLVQDGLLTRKQLTAISKWVVGGGGQKLWTLSSLPHPACVAESLQTEYKDKRMGHDRAYPTTLRDIHPLHFVTSPIIKQPG